MHISKSSAIIGIISDCERKGHAMSKPKIIADSTCDLSPEQLLSYDIDIDPLFIIMDKKSYYDLEDTSPADIFRWADANKTTPKTAAVSLERTTALFEKYRNENRDILFFGISEEMSTTCNIARLAAEELGYSEHVFVIDSQNLSTGIGLQVLYAARLAEEGLNASDITAKVLARRGKVRASFVVDTLTYLARGGRCHPVTALLGNTLKLKPEIVVESGKMGVSKKYRGTLEKVLLKYAADLTPLFKNADPSQVFITHSFAPESAVTAVRRYLEELHCFDQITVTTAGGVISSHCGPGTLGILFYEK